MFLSKTLSFWAALLVCLSPFVLADERSLFILHTNDLHDHIRPGYIGIGGLPYQSGYIQKVRSERDDVIALDSADFLEKGDYVSYVTRGETTMRAVALVGYDGVTIGNHDHDFGMEQLRRFEEILGQSFLCLNLLNPDGSTQFEKSRILTVNGIRIGLVGLIAPRRPEYGGIDLRASGEALALESQRLKAEEGVHLVVAIAHHATQACVIWSNQAPAVDVFIAGHNHEELHQPVVVDGTGAIIVQAGADGHWVGELELVVNLSEKRVVSHEGRLVLMCHEAIKPDQRIIDFVEAEEAIHTPYARRPVANIERPWGWFALARLGAEAIRREAQTDAAFIHPTQLMRNSLPAGSIDFNAVFRVGSYRTDPLWIVQLTGAEIEAYLTVLGRNQDWRQTQWAGFEASFNAEGADGVVVQTNLEAQSRYRVIMAEREWERYFLRTAERLAGDQTSPFRHPNEYHPQKAGFRFVDALVGKIESTYASGSTLEVVMEKLRQSQGGVDPMERLIEPRFLNMVNAAAYRERVVSAP
jgi:2',3'-cyclic-nucleotide 2'-phosphodiesterase (5'-nucleotidase family)